MPYLETIVCQTSKGKEARFERMIKSRVEYSKRQHGCENAWYGIHQLTNIYLSSKSVTILWTVFTM